MIPRMKKTRFLMSGLAFCVASAILAVSCTTKAPAVAVAVPAPKAVVSPEKAPEAPPQPVVIPDGEPALPGAGTKADLDMGTKRVNWNNAKWVVVPFESPRDLREFGGIRVVVSTDKPRGDAGVYLAVREADGTWYSHPWAANLTAKKNMGVALFDDFATPEWHQPPNGQSTDQDLVLDRSGINAIAFGCVNPLGVGKVSFTVDSVTLVAAPKKDAAPAKVRVSGKLLDINGTTMMPAGLFGGYHLPAGSYEKYRLAMDRPFNTFGGVSTNPVTHMSVNCYGDRGMCSPMIGNSNWVATVSNMGATAAAKVKASGTDRTYYVEWWNEPYLNWANKNRSMFRWENFQTNGAVEGGPVRLKADGSLCPYLKFTKNFDAPPWQWIEKRYTGDRDNWRRGIGADGRFVGGHAPTFCGNHPSPIPGSHPPKDVKDGEKYDYRGGQLTAVTPWWVYDETQFTYWSAKGLGRFYNEPLLTLGKTMKAIYPKTFIIAGWGFRPSEDHWDAFRLAYQPTIDFAHEVIDGIHDHDYGGDAIKMPSSHELITAYGMTRYGKWLTSWNTETASGSDPSVYGEEEKGIADQRKFAWTARKLIHALHTVPDKARSFAWFGQGELNAFSAKGEGILFEMLMNLRGRLVQIDTGDPLVYGIAVIDGADPENPRPEKVGPGMELVVCLFNDHETERDVEASITAPAGTAFSGVVTRAPNFKPDGAIIIDLGGEVLKGNEYAYKHRIPAKGAVSASFILTGTPGAKSEVVVRQSFSHDILVTVTPDKPSVQNIAIKPDDLKSARRAWLRIVTERLAEGEGTVSINGKTYVLPKAVTPENNPWIRDMPVDVADLKQANTLTFKAAAGHAGYLLAATSLYVERE
jgi:hypothetical protein